MTDQPDEFLTIEEVAKRLKISNRTLRRYIDLGTIEFFVLNPVSKRKHVRFTEANISNFITRNSKGLKTPERPKRVYNRTVVKYARKKKKPTRTRRDKAA